MEARFETFTVLINRISRTIRKIKNQEMAEYHLRSAHVSCLYYLHREERLCAVDLCERCEEDKATISRALEYLKAEGFLTSDDKRYKSLLILTEKGQVAAARIAEKIDRVLTEVEGVLTEEERDAFYCSLGKISKALEGLI